MVIRRGLTIKYSSQSMYAAKRPSSTYVAAINAHGYNGMVGNRDDPAERVTHRKHDEQIFSNVQARPLWLEVQANT